MRVELDLDGRDAGSWYDWTVFIVTPDRQSIPLVTFEGLELARIVGLPNGKHFCASIDLSFPRDYETLAFKQVIHNPITGLMVTVPVSVLTNDPGSVISPQDGWRPRLAPRPERPSLNSYWWREGEQGRLQRVRTPPPSFPHPMIEQSFYRFAYADLMNPKLTSVRYETGDVYVFPYPEWLGMGDRPGHMLGSFTGRKINSVDELPREFRVRVEVEHAALLNPDSIFKTLPVDQISCLSNFGIRAAPRAIRGRRRREPSRALGFAPGSWDVNRLNRGGLELKGRTKPPVRLLFGPVSVGLSRQSQGSTNRLSVRRRGQSRSVSAARTTRTLPALRSRAANNRRRGLLSGVNDRHDRAGVLLGDQERRSTGDHAGYVQRDRSGCAPSAFTPWGGCNHWSRARRLDRRPGSSAGWLARSRL
jgi:hypothetical protein